MAPDRNIDQDQDQHKAIVDALQYVVADLITPLQELLRQCGTGRSQLTSQQAGDLYEVMQFVRDRIVSEQTMDLPHVVRFENAFGAVFMAAVGMT